MGQLLCHSEEQIWLAAHDVSLSFSGLEENQKERIREWINRSSEYKANAFTVSIDMPSFESEFARFSEIAVAFGKKWSDDNCTDKYTIFQDTNSPVRGILRKQREGTCFMLAPIVLQHYWSCINEDPDSPTLNPAALLCTVKNIGGILDSIILNRGFSSIAFLKLISESMKFRELKIPLLEDNFHYFSCEDAFRLLKQRGPCLVSNFQCDSSFRLGGVSFGFNNEVVDNTRIHTEHCMVLVGMKRIPLESNPTATVCDERRLSDENEMSAYSRHRYVFLLQNSWESRFFIEVTSEYLASSGATLFFVAEGGSLRLRPITRHSVDHLPYLETSLDTSDVHLPEARAKGLCGGSCTCCYSSKDRGAVSPAEHFQLRVV